MQEILVALEELNFYIYEEPALVSIIQALQLSSNSLWIMDGRHDKLELLNVSPKVDPLEMLEEALYIYSPLPPHRCFSIDQEDLYEQPSMIFENEYLSDSLRKCGVNIESVDEYEDSNGNFHLITDAGDFLICPSKFRSSRSQSTDLIWQVVTAKSLLMLNNLLFKAGSYEKLYVLRQRSEELIVVVLLNPNLFNFLQSELKLEDESLPKLVEKYFGKVLNPM